MSWSFPEPLARCLRELRRFAAEVACPPACAACLADLDAPGLLCDLCRSGLAADLRSFCFACGENLEGRLRHARQAACRREAHRHFRARCLFWMRGPMPPLLHQFKYNGVTRLAGEWGEALGACLLMPPDLISAPAPAPDLILPVPLHPRRRAERGYNQSALLARAAAARAGLPCVEDALARTRATATQTLLRPRARRTNLAGAFTVLRPTLVAGRRVVLVDDVVTTGATLQALAGALAAAGARSVSAVAVARA